MEVSSSGAVDNPLHQRHFRIVNYRDLHTTIRRTNGDNCFPPLLPLFSTDTVRAGDAGMRLVGLPFELATTTACVSNPTKLSLSPAFGWISKWREIGVLPPPRLFVVVWREGTTFCFGFCEFEKSKAAFTH